MIDPDAPVDNTGLVVESVLIVDSPGSPDVKLPDGIIEEPEDVVVASVEKLIPLVRLPLALTEVRTDEEIGDVVEDMPEPGILENPVGPTVTIVELVIGNGMV